MIGAIVGDVIGSVHEAAATKTKRFPLFTPESHFTDDTVLTLAVADVLANGGDYVSAFHRYYRSYPRAGYGGQFRRWCQLRHTEPYNSWGNGSAMRVAPVGMAFDRMTEVLAEAERSARVTHDHPEGIRGAQATAAAVFLARRKPEKREISDHVTSTFGYRLDVPLDDVRDRFTFDVSCEGTVPWSLRSFLEADTFEATIRNAISLGGDADTLACIAGAVAGPYFGVPDDMVAETLARLDDRLRAIVTQFLSRFGSGKST